jgi:hypothetical protein
VPILGQFHKWLEAQRPEVLPKSPMAEALGYALNNWAALVRYTEAGFLAIDNNVAEREMKRIAIGSNYAEPLIMRSRQDPCHRLRPTPRFPWTVACGHNSA